MFSQNAREEVILDHIQHRTCQGLIFVVDSNDRERITEAQEELQKMVGFKITTKHWKGPKCIILVDSYKKTSCGRRHC